MRYAILLVIVIVIVSSGLLYSLNKTEEDIRCKDCNLIMISLSNVSAEHMSLYGYERLTTPSLDEWAKDAIVFENAFAQTSWTLPTATSLFTSLYPYSHKIMDRFVDNVLDENIETLPEILQERGYKTAAFVGGLDYSSSFGHMRGFGEVDEAMDVNMMAISFAGFGSTLAKGLEWLEGNAENKFFLFLHGYDAHCPFDPPQHLKGTFSTTQDRNITVDNKICLRGFEVPQGKGYEAYYYRDKAEKVTLTQDDIMYLEELYDEEILSVDGLVGRFLGALDGVVPPNTIIVVFSDHGEVFAKHGRFGRAGGVRGTLYDEVLHIPMLIKIPEQNGRRISGLVQIIDFMPGIFDILEIPKPEQAQGKSVLPLLRGKESEINDYVFTGSEFGAQEGRLAWLFYKEQSVSESLRSKEWKLIYEVQLDEGREIKEESYELYNLIHDPGELRNLIGGLPVETDGLPVQVSRLRKILENWADEAKSYDAKATSEPQLLPPKIIEASKEHGYW